jgi:hypothetical protein
MGEIRNTKKIYELNIKDKSRVSSGSIVSDYRLEDRAIEVRSTAGAKHFYSILALGPTQVLSNGYRGGGPFPRGKGRPGRDADHSPPSRAEVVNK